MIKTFKGDIFNAPHGWMVHGCNSKGVMASGIAKQVRQKCPAAYEAYKKSPRLLGTVTSGLYKRNYHIINGITQNEYGRDTSVRYVNYGAIANVFSQVREDWMRYADEDTPVLFPLIGGGLGNGDWEIISEIITVVLGDRIPAHLYTL